jgi:transposase-like protein
LTRFPGHLTWGEDRLGEESWISAAKPLEIRHRAVKLGRQQEKPIAEIADVLGIAESCTRRRTKLDDVDAGRVEGTTSDDRAELVRLRRELRVAKMEIEILKRASDTSGGRATR